MDTESKKNSIRDILRLVFRKRVLFQVGACLFAIGILIVAHFMPLQYTGKAIFEFGLEAAAEEISRTSSDSFGTIKERMVHDMAGYNAVEQAIKELHLTEGIPRDREGRLTYEGKAALQGKVNRFMDCVEVEWEARSKQEDLVSVSFTDADPKIAENMPNVLVKNYINRTYERIIDGLKRQHDFLQKKVNDSAAKFDDATKEKIDFETNHAGMLPENPSLFQEKMERANAELKAARRIYEISRLRTSRLDALRAQATGKEAAGQTEKIIMQPNPELGRLQTQLRDLEDELNDSIIIRHMTQAHPTVKALKVKIAQTEQRIAAAPREVLRETVFATGVDLLDLSMDTAAAKSELAAAKNDIQRLEGLMSEYDKAWANFAPVRKDYLALLNKYDNAREEADHWNERLKSVQIGLAAAVDHRLTRLKAIQPAQEQYIPSSPRLSAVLALAIVGGLAFGGGLVFFAKVLDRSIGMPKEACEYFQLPVHGVIGEIIVPSQRAKMMFRKWFVTPAVSVVLVVTLILSMTSAITRLRNPKKYNEFWNSPTAFVANEVAPAIGNILGW